MVLDLNSIIFYQTPQILWDILKERAEEFFGEKSSQFNRVS